MGPQRGLGGVSGNFVGCGGNCRSGGGTLAMVEILVEEEFMVVEVVAAGVVMEEVMLVYWIWR